MTINQCLACCQCQIDRQTNLEYSNLHFWCTRSDLTYRILNAFIADDCVHGSSVENVSPSEMLTMDMSGMIVVNMKLSPKDGWTLQTYKIMPRYRVNDM